jgi:hypothetical protein
MILLHSFLWLWRGNELRLVLSGDRAVEFDAEAVRAVGGKEPVIAIFLGTLPKTTRGNWYDAIRFMLVVLVVSCLCCYMLLHFLWYGLACHLYRFVIFMLFMHPLFWQIIWHPFRSVCTMLLHVYAFACWICTDKLETTTLHRYVPWKNVKCILLRSIGTLYAGVWLCFLSNAFPAGVLVLRSSSACRWYIVEDIPDIKYFRARFVFIG